MMRSEFARGALIGFLLVASMLAALAAALFGNTLAMFCSILAAFISAVIAHIENERTEGDDGPQAGDDHRP